MTRVVNIAQSGGNNVTMRNKIINGAMMIDQRNNGASSTWTGSNTIFIADRFTVSLFGTTYSNPAITAQQATDAPSGFTNSIKVTSSSTITPDANKLGCWMQQIVEGFNSADLAWGTASASPVTISFRVKASKTGNVSVSIENASTARSYVTTVAISAAGTWETKTVTIPGDTSGTWDTTNGVGLSVKFGVMSNGSWLAGAGGSWSGTRAVLSTSQTNFIAASGDYIAFTGVQLEAGTTATPFEQRLYGTELLLCQRYYEVLWTSSLNWQGNVVSIYNTTRAFIKAWHKATKRANPTITVTSPSFVVAYNNNVVTATASNNQYPTTDSTSIEITGSYTLGYSGHVDINSGCVITASAEL